jgi:hypothetical protein
MMKKVMFVVVMVLAASACFAQLQSPPSNITGYVKVTVNSGTPAVPFFKDLGLPFKFWDVPAGGIPTYGTESTNPSDIFGDQPNCTVVNNADLVWRQDNGNTGRRATPTCTWSGSLESGAGGAIPGRAYWYVNKSGAARDIVVAGQVDNAGGYGTTPCAEAGSPPPAATFTAYSWRDSRSLPRDNVGLRTQHFRGGATPNLSDLVWEQSSGFTCNWHTTGTPGWGGSLLTFEPGKAYWIVNRQNPEAGGGLINYTYAGTGTPGPENIVIRPVTKPVDNGGSLEKIRTTPVVKANKGTRN